MKRDKTNNALIVGAMFICVIAGLGIGLLAKSAYVWNGHQLTFDSYEVGHISCATNSMGLTIRCNDEVYSRTLPPDEPLRIGAIYGYTIQDSEQIMIHRLVQCLDASCTTGVFKGDNNLQAEIVNRSRVKYIIEMVKYAEGITPDQYKQLGLYNLTQDEIPTSAD